MIKGILTVIVCAICTLSNAQFNSKGETRSKFRPGLMWFYNGIRPEKSTYDDVRKYDRLIIDVTYNDWDGDSGPFENHWASIGMNTNLMFDIPFTSRNTVSLGIGVAYQYVNIRHDNKLVIDDAKHTTIYTPKDKYDLFDKSIFSGNSFSMPLELRFRTKNWRHFKFHIGVKIGYQVNMLSKRVLVQEGHSEHNKRYGFPDENKLLYSAHVRIGIRSWALFGSYNFNSLFSNANSTQLNLIQMGISVSLF
mgnify:CR=1 FL=1